MTKRQRENFDKLLAALRSGEYRQGRSFLRLEDSIGYKFCCMGVGCDIVKDQIDGSWEDGRFCEGEWSSACLPTPRASEAFGITVYGGEWVLIKDPGIVDRGLHAVSANDSVRLTFPQIADCLEWEYGNVEVQS